MAFFDADPRTYAAALVGASFNQLPDVAIVCDHDTLAFRLSCAKLVLDFKAKMNPLRGRPTPQRRVVSSVAVWG